MANSNQPRNSLNLAILPPATQKAFDFMLNQKWLEQESWYLAGGTALALQMGHRLSVDLDFFTSKTHFDTQFLVNRLTSSNWITTLREENTLYGELFEAKMSFIAYPYFLPAQPLIKDQTLALLEASDIAVMKVIAISQRGRKRDFIDLFWYISMYDETLLSVIKKVETQYPNLKHNYHHLFKSLVYFEEAENEPEPEMLIDNDWEAIKSFFTQEVPKISHNYL